MHIVTTLAIIANILAILILLIGLFYKFEQPKIKAIYGYNIAGFMLLYMVTLGIVALYWLTVNHNLYGIILLLCIISPFVIGKLVRYETLKQYTVVQIMCFTASLIILFLQS